MTTDAVREPSVVVRRGTVSVFFAFDTGQSIDLEEARRHLGTLEPSVMAHRRRAPTYFQFDPPPLRVLQASEPHVVAGRSLSPQVECALFDFGAISVRYDLPFDGPLDDLVPISVAIGESEELSASARRRAAALLEVVRPAVTKLLLASPVEDYLVVRIEETDAAGALEDFLEGHGTTVARILGAFDVVPSNEEVADLLQYRASYGRDDLVVVDWNGALVLGRDMDDVVDVLEFANLQLLEMRFLDGGLDGSLDRAYEAIAEKGRLWSRVPERALERVARMQVDAAVLFERVGNALKLLGDQWLARVHRLAGKRFHLDEWNASIQRKLDTIESIYQKLFDRASARRMETLEWLIIALIVISIVIPFLWPGYAGH
jgi:hypothetical protein